MPTSLEQGILTEHIEDLKKDRNFDDAMELVDALIKDIAALDSFMENLPHWAFHALTVVYAVRLKIGVEESCRIAYEDCFRLATMMLDAEKFHREEGSCVKPSIPTSNGNGNGKKKRKPS